MVAWLIPAVLSGVSYLFGKSSGGGGIDIARGLEVGTLKKQQTNAQQYTQTTTSTYAPVYAPSIQRSFDIQYNIASGYGSAISTKKDLALTQQPDITSQPTVTPTIIPSMALLPSQGSGGGVLPSGGGAGFDYASILIVGGLGLGAYYLLKSNKKRRGK